MNTFTNDKKERTITQAARKMADDLVRRAQEILQKDVIREPELLPDEAARVAELEAQIANVGPKMTDMEAQLNADEARVKELQSLCGFSGFMNGENLDVLVSEREHLKHMGIVKASVLHDGLMVLSQSTNEIEKIKQAAREREVQNGK